MERVVTGGRLHPMAQLDVHEAALSARLGVEEAPYHPPSARFYHSNYILDGCRAANLRTAYGYYASAQKQLLSFRNTQRADGMVPGVSHPPSGFTLNPERLLSSAPFDGNDYTQTPDWARSVLDLHETAHSRPAASTEQAINPDEFLRRIYPYLGRYYDYFMLHRQVAGDDHRTFLLHPHEANRDSGPEYNVWKQAEMEKQLGKTALKLLHQRPRRGERMPWLFNHSNIVRDYLGALAINVAGFREGWDPRRIRERGEFVDVWFNSILQRNYSAMSELAGRLGRDEDFGRYQEAADKLEQSILGKNFLFNPKRGKEGFYSTYNGQPMLVHTIGSLAAALLPNLEPRHLQSNLDLMDEGFNTPFPLPSVAAFEVQHYDPHYEEHNRHWQGLKLTVADEFVMDGLDTHMDRDDEIPEKLRNRCWEWFYKIHNSNNAVVEVTGDYAEYYDPVTGMGQRMGKTRGHVFGIPKPLR